MGESKQKSLKKNDEYRRRLELIQDFGFKAAAQRIKITPDRNYIYAAGYHPFSVSSMSGAGAHCLSRCS